MVITLHIKAQDILETQYLTIDNALTRALQRAGVDARDVGLGVIHGDSLEMSDEYDALADKVTVMYMDPTRAVDFDFPLNIPEEWITNNQQLNQT